MGKVYGELDERLAKVYLPPAGVLRGHGAVPHPGRQGRPREPLAEARAHERRNFATRAFVPAYFSLRNGQSST